jgi:segregation and condensation protein A
MYKVKLEEFEGPLDLLLFLIKKDEIDIYDIPIAKITEQYLEYLELIELLDLDIAGEFLVMAATLMHIKSKMLLPPEERAPEEVEEEDPRAELVRRLIEYKAFKEAAGQLQFLEARQRDIFHRPGDMDAVQIECGGEKFFEASLFDLISAFSVVLANVPKETFMEVIKEHITVEQKIHDILHMLVEKPCFTIKDLFEKAISKIEIAVIFLALLELMKTHSILAVQKELFGEIEIIRNPKAIEPNGNQ